MRLANLFNALKNQITTVNAHIKSCPLLFILMADKIRGDFIVTFSIITAAALEKTYLRYEKNKSADEPVL